MPLYHRLLLSAGLLLLLVSSLAGAAAKRTFVASTGVDNPNCQITTPCRTFAAAITATNAGGEVIVQDSAGYGAVTITKSVSIISPPGIYAGVSVFSGNGITINAPAATVVLRGVSINGQGGAIGILVQQAARVRIESCVVSNMGAQGIYHHANGGEVIVLDTIARDNGDRGFALVAKDASIVLDHARSEHNQNAGFYAAPVPGATFVHVTISDSLFANNGGVGIWADSVSFADTIVEVERTTVTGNIGDGIEATASANSAFVYLVVTRSTFGGNRSGVHALVPQGGEGGVLSNVSENSVGTNSILADGLGASIFASGNMGVQRNLACQNGAVLRSFGDNHTIGTSIGTCDFAVISGY